jgi:hypothetical protein
MKFSFADRSNRRTLFASIYFPYLSMLAHERFKWHESTKKFAMWHMNIEGSTVHWNFQAKRVVHFICANACVIHHVLAFCDNDYMLLVLLTSHTATAMRPRQRIWMAWWGWHSVWLCETGNDQQRSCNRRLTTPPRLLSTTATGLGCREGSRHTVPNNQQPTTYSLIV